MAKAKKDNKRKKVIGIIAAVAAVLVLVLAVFMMARNNSTDNGDTPDTPGNGESVTVEGVYACLPKGDGPQTMECAFGLRTDDNVYYGLNFAELDDPAASASITIGDRLRVSGTFEEQEQSVYLSDGVIIVDSLEEL